MNEKLAEIRIQMKALSELIHDLLESTNQERIFIKREDFRHIRHVAKLNSYLHAFEYTHGIFFTLANSSSYPYEFSHYSKLMSGELERLILIKVEKEYTTNDIVINYELEPAEKTRLFDLYVEAG